MVVLKSEAIDDLSSFSNPSATRELKHWEKLDFAFDMDQSNNLGNSQHPRSTSESGNGTQERQTPMSSGIDPQDAALLAQLSASGSAGFPPGYPSMVPPGQFGMTQSQSQFFEALYHHHNPAPQLPPLSSLDFPWHTFTHAQPPVPVHGPHFGQPSNIQTIQHDPSLSTSSFGTIHPIASSSEVQAGPSTSAGRSGSSSGRGASASPEVEMTEAERQAIAEEKRRRNTAASARFRVKKKNKTVTLERSVSELTGRAEELEREVADLRRENGWLKEIVMLKGTRFAANNFNHQLALSQAAALATGQVITDSGTVPGPAVAGPSGTSQDDEEDSESETDDEEYDPKSKGKAKAKSTSKK